MSAYIKLLKSNRDFAKLWLASAISLTGDWFNTIVLVAIVARISDGSGLAVSGYLLAKMLPPVIVSPFAGVLADRLNRKHILIAADALRGVIVLLFLVAIHLDALWMIYALTLLQFSLTSLFDPAKSAFVPSLVQQENLVLANTLGSVTWSAMLAFGSLAGGLFAAFFGVTAAILLDAATFGFSALLITSIRQSGTPQSNEFATSESGSGKGFFDGIHYARRNPDASVSLLVKIGDALPGNMGTLMAIFATQLYVIGDNGEQSLGLLYGAAGIGAILGPIVLNTFNNGTVRRMRQLVVIGYGFITVGWIALIGSTNLTLVALAIVIQSMGGSANWTYSDIMIQKTTHNAYLGRMFSFDMILLYIGSTVSTLITGSLVDLIGIQSISILVTGIAVLSLIPMVIWFSVTQSLDHKSSVRVAAAGD